MATLITSQEIYEPPEGALITPADFVNLIGNLDNAIGLLALLFGLNDALPPGNPVAIALQGGFNIIVGGPGQTMLAQGRILDNCAATPLSLANSNAQSRIDLIAVQATRVPGAQAITRTVIPDSAPLQYVPYSGSMVAGVLTITFGQNYPASPEVMGVAAINAHPGGGTPQVTAISRTSITISSLMSDGVTVDTTDTRTVGFLIYGTPNGYNGSAETLSLLENQPAWQVVEGTPSANPAVPATPSGYEAFATVLIPSGSSQITAGDITVLFPTLPALSGGVIETLTPGVGIELGGTPANPVVELAHGDYVDLANPQTKAGALTLTALLTGTQALFSGAIGAGSAAVQGAFSAASASVTGAFAAATATISGAFSAASATITAGISAATATITGMVQAGSATITGNLTAGVTQLTSTLRVEGNATFDQNCTFDGNVTFMGGSIAIAALASQPVLNVDPGPHVTAVPSQGGATVTVDAPPRSIASFGATAALTGASASIELPNTELTYQLVVDWIVNTNQDTPSIASPSSGVSGFVAISGANGSTGANGANHFARAVCNAVGSGQTLSFALSASGGSGNGSNNGIWTITAIATSQ